MPLQAEEIRLIKIIKVFERPDWSAVEVTVVHQDLNHCPDYLAVSYAWDTPRGKTVIQANDEDITLIPITSNLYDFLCAQHRQLAGRMLWIDQICVNQHNLPERASQVRLMARIFENATETIIRLGKEDEDTSVAFECIQDLSAATEELDTMSAEWGSYPISKTLVEGPRRPLLDLLARSWFSRLWALQEAVLGAAPRFVCGTHSASWDEFSKAVYNAILTFHIDVAISIPVMNVLRKRRFKGQHISLFSLLVETWMFSCYDPRDKVYALLSMQSSLPQLQIDYTAKVEDVYVSVARALIKFTRSLEILGAVDSNDPWHGPQGAALPSWVPDWRGLSSENHFPEYYPFQACKDLVPRHTESISRILKVEGRIIDNVSKVEQPGDFERLTRFKENLPAARAYLEDLYDRIQHSGSTPPRLLLGQVVRTILAGHYGTYGRPLVLITEIEEEEIWTLLNSDGTDDSGGNDSHSMWLEVTKICRGRTILELDQRFVALGPPNTEPGDAICILHGSKLPVVLRRQDDKWRFIGQCYVDGVMFGEAVTWIEEDAETFELT